MFYQDIVAPNTLFGNIFCGNSIYIICIHFATRFHVSHLNNTQKYYALLINPKLKTMSGLRYEVFEIVDMMANYYVLKKN